MATERIFVGEWRGESHKGCGGADIDADGRLVILLCLLLLCADCVLLFREKEV